MIIVRKWKSMSFKSTSLALLLLVFALGTIVVPQPKVASATGTTYYFSTSGDDANNGTSPSTPKQSISAANTLLSAGHSVLFKRGDAWYRNSVNGAGTKIGGTLQIIGASGTSAAPIVVGAYGIGAKPMISLTYLLSKTGWISDGTNRYKHAIPAIGIGTLRLFEDGVSKFKVNTNDTNANETDVDQPYEWYANNGFVYVGSTTGAPQHVELIGNDIPVLVRNANYVTIQNLDIKGGVVDVEAPSSHITIDNNTIRQTFQSGIRAYNREALNNPNPTPQQWAQYVSDLTITNNVIDKVWTQEENHTNPDITYGGEGIFLLDAVEGGLIRGNTILNFGHGGISLETSLWLGTNRTHGVHHVLVELNDVSSGNSDYMHGFGVIGLPGKTTNNTIRRNYFHDFQATSHVGGRDNYIYSNIFVGVTETPRQTKQPFAMDVAPWPVREKGTTAAQNITVDLESQNLFIVNNTILDTDGYAIEVRDYNKTKGNVTNIQIANNLMGQYADDSSYLPVGLNVSSEVTGMLTVNNNAFWDSSTTVARYKTLTNAAINTLNACETTYSLDTCNNNATGDPLFVNYANRDFHLSANSPFKASGSNAYLAALGSGFVDYYGNPWDPTSPSIGAIQY
ncbi:right-handed parallel beta-helix repeat-containing protein [Paenibacillus methanolicus]|uniref:Parallel beta helix pectate lyase-like protein n=1 Tax=Paenibacillus methanolicus TaxID=582686 RepID=A0A5S5CLZ9_9BACL|nr:right-handed parallel beta-helix repeat-containing protein [Paenibacillus methanolicus]TYP79418.1 parallel beta helix pectate lyase-like protein [Paenibacillus methanolicus]